MANRATSMSPASSRRHFLMMGLVTAGVIKTTGISDGKLADSLINVSHASDWNETARLGAVTTYVGDIKLDNFSTTAPRVPERFDTPPEGTRLRIRRKRERRKKLKRVVDNIIDFVFPAAHAASASTAPSSSSRQTQSSVSMLESDNAPNTNVSLANLSIEIGDNGEWRATLDAKKSASGETAFTFTGSTTDSDSGLHLTPVGPGCETLQHQLDVTLSLLSVTESQADYALTAHQRDGGGLKFAAFGNLPRTSSVQDMPESLCENRTNMKRRSLLLP